MLRALLVTLLITPLRRLFRGPLRPRWSFRYELTTRVMKRGFASIWRRDVPEQRRLSEALARPPQLAVRFSEVAGADVRAEWCEPTSGKTHDGVYGYFHGGGFTTGSTNTHRASIARQTLAIAGRTLSVDYRLAPEHRFPAQIDDALAVYDWLRRTGCSPEQMIFGGDSAGANLALAALLVLRHRHLPMPRAGVLLCPWVDMSARGGSLEAHARFDWAEPQHFLAWQTAYLGEATPPTHPLASPTFADLRGQPPLLVQVGTAEMLVDQVREFAKKAKTAYVDVTLREYEDLVHNWHVLDAETCPESQPAIEEIGAFCRARWEQATGR
jgi:acetyl esterase/lipase